MNIRLGTLFLLSSVLTEAHIARAQSAGAGGQASGGAAAMAPKITIDSPMDGDTVHRAAIIKFHVDNLTIASVAAPPRVPSGPNIYGHVHVSLDSARWHRLHSTTDPVILVLLSPGEHTVELQLVDANHNLLDVKTVRFVFAPSAAAAHRP